MMETLLETLEVQLLHNIHVHTHKFMLLDITGNWAGSPAGSHGDSSFEDPSGHTGSGDHKGGLH